MSVPGVQVSGPSLVTLRLWLPWTKVVRLCAALPPSVSVKVTALVSTVPFSSEGTCTTAVTRPVTVGVNVPTVQVTVRPTAPHGAPAQLTSVTSAGSVSARRGFNAGSVPMTV